MNGEIRSAACLVLRPLIRSSHIRRPAHRCAARRIRPGVGRTGRHLVLRAISQGLDDHPEYGDMPL
jgi:hypothetical protein